MVFPWDVRPGLAGQEELIRIYESGLVAQQQQQLQQAPVAAAMAPRSTTNDSADEIHSWELPIRNHQYAALPQLAASFQQGLPWGQNQQVIQPQTIQQQALQQQRAFQQAMLASQMGQQQVQQNPYSNVPTHLLQSMLAQQLKVQQQSGGLADRAAGTSLEANSAPDQAHNPEADRINPKKKRKLDREANSSSGAKQPAKKTPSKKDCSSNQKKAKQPEGTLPKPKRPLSAYNMFFKEAREAMLVQRMQDQAESSKKGGFGGMAKEVGAKWKALDPETRRMYEERATVAKDKYLQHLKQWEEETRKEEDRIASEALVMMQESSMDEDDESEEEELVEKVETASSGIKMDSFGKKLFKALVDKKTSAKNQEEAGVEYDSEEEELVGDDSKPGRSAPFVGRKRAAPAASDMNLVNAMYLSMLANSQQQQQAGYPQRIAAVPAQRQGAASMSQAQKIARGSSSSSLSEAANENFKPSPVKKQSSRRNKKPKDKPKRPLSSYNLFFRDERERLIAAKSDDEDKLGFQEMGRLVGQSWKALPKEERAVYDKKAEEEKRKYFQAVNEWKQSKNEKEEAAMVMVSNLQMGWIRETYPGKASKDEPKPPSQTKREAAEEPRFGESVDDDDSSAKKVAELPKPDKAQSKRDNDGGMSKWDQQWQQPQVYRQMTKAWKRKEDGKPKRPLSGYNLFFKDEREKIIKADHEKKLGFQEMARTLGAKWKSLDAETRESYDQQAVEEKRKYFQALEDWKQAKLAAKGSPMAIRGGGFDILASSEQQPTACLHANERVVESAEAESGERTESLGGDEAQKRAPKETEIPKCSKCGKRAARACSQLACLNCCSDMQCEGHKEPRERALLDSAILSGTTEINRKAAAKRAAAIIPGTFREPGFAYLGETAMLWSLRDYLAVPKWRDDAVRRSIKRNQLDTERKSLAARGPAESTPKRFKRVMDDLYQQSLQAVEPCGDKSGAAK